MLGYLGGESGPEAAKRAQSQGVRTTFGKLWENLDEDDGREFAGQVQGALQRIESASQRESRSSGKIARKGGGREGRKARLNAAAAALKETEEEQMALEMDEDWMTFSVTPGKSQQNFWEI